MREKWFPEVHHHCPGVPCLIVGTQTDLRDDPSVREKLGKQKMSPVKKEDGEKMARELGAVKYVECSALTQYKLKDVFDEVSALASVERGMLISVGDCGSPRTTTNQEAERTGKVSNSMTALDYLQLTFLSHLAPTSTCIYRSPLLSLVYFRISPSTGPINLVKG